MLLSPETYTKGWNIPILKMNTVESRTNTDKKRLLENNNKRKISDHWEIKASYIYALLL